MSFPEGQDGFRASFIKESRQKAWGAACHAEWIAKQLDEVLTNFQKLQKEDGELEREIKALETAIDYHTVENRNKRKELQERRNIIAKSLQAFSKNVENGQKAIVELSRSIDTNLALAKHAEAYEWKETEAKPEK